MASPYLQRPPRSLSEVRGELERRHRGEHHADPRESADAESGGEALEPGDRSRDF